MSNIKRIIAGTCPNCGKAKVFKYSNPYNLAHLADMHKYCPNCKKNFEREPGFYFGAMYVSYAITVIIAAITMLVFWGIFNLATLPLLAILSGIILLTFPLIFRVSRMIWLSWFIDRSE